MIYFDNASTTKPCEKAIEMAAILGNIYGNPSSLHTFGMEAEKLLDRARQIVGAAIGQRGEDIIFTSGGTESNAMAIFGVLSVAKRQKYITSMSEHPSVKSAMEEISKSGQEVIFLPVDESGHISLEALEKAVDENTKLVSIIHVNNETGVIENIEDMGKIIKDKNKRTLFHVDGVQGFLKHPLDLDKAKVDFYTGTAHKIHGFKGTGFLYIRKNVFIKPLFYGGDQEYGKRPGTENILGITAMGKAIENFSMGEVVEIKQAMKKLLDIPYSFINTASHSPYILNMSFLGIGAEILVNALARENIFISAGAACSVKRPTSLDYLPIDKNRVESAVRFSFSGENTLLEAKSARKIVMQLVRQLRKQIGEKYE